MYETIQDVDDLRKRLMQTWSDFDQDIIAAATDQWRDRASGGHFRHESRLVRQYKLLYKPMAKSMGMGKFRPPTAPKPLNRFWWNSKLRTITWRPPTTQDFISIRQRGWSRRITSLPLLWFLSLSFFGLVTRTGRTGGPILTIYTSYDVFLPTDVPFGGLVDVPPHLGGQIPQKNNFGGVNRRFPAKLLKSKNMHIIKTIASIPTMNVQIYDSSEHFMKL